eukprot:717-Heterococcus_DN1.PRE.2
MANPSKTPAFDFVQCECARSTPHHSDAAYEQALDSSALHKMPVDVHLMYSILKRPRQPEPLRTLERAPAQARQQRSPSPARVVRGVQAAAAQQPAAEATTTASTTAAATVATSRPLDTNAADSMTASTNIKPMETVEVQHTEPEALQGDAPGTTAAEGLPSSIDAKTAGFLGESNGSRGGSSGGSNSDSDDDDDEQPGNNGAVTAVKAAKPTHAAVPDSIAAALLTHELSSADATAPSTRVQGVGEGGESLGHDVAQHREEPATAAAAAAAAEVEAALKAVLFVNGRDATSSSGSAGAAEGHTTGAPAPAQAVAPAPAPAPVLTEIPN